MPDPEDEAHAQRVLGLHGLLLLLCCCLFSLVCCFYVFYCLVVWLFCSSWPSSSPRDARPISRGWRNTVGNLIEIVWLNKTCHGPQFTAICGKNNEGYGFIEFELSNSTTSTVFGQPLQYPISACARTHRP